MILTIAIGSVLSSVIALIAYQRRSLTISGVIAAVLFATMIYVFAGAFMWVLLMLFFISSSVLTNINKRILKKTIDTEKKGRNYVQVIANAFVATLFSFLFYLLKENIYFVAAAASIAASNADTWASEIGTLSKGDNYNILTWKKMDKGLSGAVTFLGLLASIAGALLIGIFFVVIDNFQSGFNFVNTLTNGFIISFGGFLGAIIDSVFGALIQAKYKDTKTGKVFEHKRLATGSVVLVSGFAIITNDAVNFISALFASIMTVVFFG